MEFLLPFTSSPIAAIFAFTLFLYYLLWISKIARRNNGPNKKAPEPAGAWPIIGHLHLLCGSHLPHITLGFMADKYGPIFTIKLGVHRTLVVSDWQIAKECFTTNDKTFANRPQSVAVELMGYNYAMFGLGPYGAYWRHMRKIVTVELLSNKQLHMFGPIRESEVKASIKEIYQLWVKNKGGDGMVKMEMKQWFGRLTLNMVVRMLVGKRYSVEEEEGRRTQEALREFFELAGRFVVSEAIPFMKWLDLGGYEKAMKKTAREIDEILEGWLEEHKRKRNSSKVKDDQHPQQEDFMDVMMSILEDASSTEIGGFDADTINKSTCLVILTGGTDTSTVTLIWALSLLLNNRHALKKAQEELDIHVGRNRQVEESDLNNLVYLQAILKETLRLYPAGALLAAHESMEDCMVGGYNIPKGTRLVVNLSKLHRDPHVWSNPYEFEPERFLTRHKDVDFRGQNFEYLPFGSGRRSCPGISLGLQVLGLTLASLIHGFEFATPSDEPIDMSESFGLSNIKSTPLEVILTPRLSSYE